MLRRAGLSVMGLDYLRVSVTDRCNLRCVYCNPLGGTGFIQPEEILSYEEIVRLVRLFVGRGVRKVRLTGGEPLVRKDIIHLVQQLASVEGIKDLAMTTNGVLLGETAGDLKAAGLIRVNVSIDSMAEERYEKMTGANVLKEALAGIQSAVEVGLKPVKINVVTLKGINDEDVMSFAEMAGRLGVIVRFIEYYPTEKNIMPASEHVPNSRIRQMIGDSFGKLTGIVSGDGGGPATYYKLGTSAGVVGFISGRSSVFCDSCSRVRLTSDGRVRPCLYSAYDYDLKILMRQGASDAQILNVIDRIIREKKNYTKLNSFTEDFSMRQVGG